MPRHMGVELPLLFLAGWFAALYTGASLIPASSAWNAAGLPGLLFAMATSGFWMIPAALDLAVLSPVVGFAKVTSLVAAGFVACLSWRVARMAIQAFFVLNWFWMTLAAGLLYQEAPQQLCSVYLADQQGQAGRAMAAWACAGLLAWIWSVARMLLSAEDAERADVVTCAAGEPANSQFDLPSAIGRMCSPPNLRSEGQSSGR